MNPDAETLPDERTGYHLKPYTMPMPMPKMKYRISELHGARTCAALLDDVEDAAAEGADTGSVEKETEEVDEDGNEEVVLILSAPVTAAYPIVVPLPSTTTPFGPALRVCPSIVMAEPEMLKVRSPTTMIVCPDESVVATTW